MYPPYWEHKAGYGWQLEVPILMQYVNGLVQIGTRSTGVYVHTPMSAEWFPCEPELRDFVLASCMEFLEAYYVLKNGDT